MAPCSVLVERIPKNRGRNRTFPVLEGQGRCGDAAPGACAAELCLDRQLRILGHPRPLSRFEEAFAGGLTDPARVPGRTSSSFKMCSERANRFQTRACDERRRPAVRHSGGVRPAPTTTFDDQPTEFRLRSNLRWTPGGHRGRRIASPPSTEVRPADPPVPPTPTSRGARAVLERLEPRLCLSNVSFGPRSRGPRCGHLPSPWRWGTSTATASPTWPRPTRARDSVSVLLGNGDGTFAAPSSYAVGGRRLPPWRWGTSTATASPTWPWPTRRRQQRQRAAGQRRRHLRGRRQLRRRRPGLAPWRWGTSTATASPTWPWPTTAATPSACCWATATAPSPAAVSYAAGDGPASVAVGDFNGDGKPDLAVANCNSATTSACCWATATAPSPRAVTLRRRDGARLRGGGGLQRRRQARPGRGQLPTSDDSVERAAGQRRRHLRERPVAATPSGTAPTAVAVGDFNGDGQADLAVANVGGNFTVSVLLNTTPTSPSVFQIADVSYSVNEGAGTATITVKSHWRDVGGRDRPVHHQRWHRHRRLGLHRRDEDPPRSAPARCPRLSPSRSPTTPG